MATLVSIAITPNPPELSAGGSQQLTATGTNADATTVNLTNKVTWASGDTDVARFSAGVKGRLTARGEGATGITAAYLGIVGSVNVTVAAVEP